MSDTIDLAVLDDMRLFVSPQEIARDGDHNSAIFRVTQRPDTVDGMVCRAEVTTSNGTTTYRLVVNDEFTLTNEISVAGIGYLQLVYFTNQDTILKKTTVVPFHVSRSLNAIDESDPDF